MARPRIKNGEKTHRTGFSVNESAWLLFKKEADARGISYSELFRELVEAQNWTDASASPPALETQTCSHLPTDANSQKL